MGFYLRSVIYLLTSGRRELNTFKTRFITYSTEPRARNNTRSRNFLFGKLCIVARRSSILIAFLKKKKNVYFSVRLSAGGRISQSPINLLKGTTNYYCLFIGFHFHSVIKGFSIYGVVVDAHLRDRPSSITMRD
jgi:hypothetical protein